MGKVQGCQLFVLHEHELQYFSFDLPHSEASKPQYVESAHLIVDSHGNIIEAFRVLKHSKGEVKLSYLSILDDCVAKSFAISLFIKSHVLE